MKYFYDGCCPQEFSEVLAKGCISGVTTNVNFVIDYAKKNHINSYFAAINPLYQAACSTNRNLPFSVQSVGNNKDELLSSALKIRDKFGNNVDLYMVLNFRNNCLLNRLLAQQCRNFLYIKKSCENNKKIKKKNKKKEAI